MIIAACILSFAILAAAMLIASHGPEPIDDHEDVYAGDGQGVQPMSGYCTLRVDVQEAAPDPETGEAKRHERYWLVKSSGSYVVGAQKMTVDIPEGSRVHLIPGAPSVSYETMPVGHTTARLCDIACWVPEGQEARDRYEPQAQQDADEPEVTLGAYPESLN